MDGSGVKEQKIGTNDNRSSGFINSFGEILVKKDPNIKQGIRNNIQSSTGQDSVLILPQKIKKYKLPFAMFFL